MENITTHDTRGLYFVVFDCSEYANHQIFKVTGFTDHFRPRPELVKLGEIMPVDANAPDFEPLDGEILMINGPTAQQWALELFATVPEHPQPLKNRAPKGSTTEFFIQTRPDAAFIDALDEIGRTLTAYIKQPM